MGIKMKNARLYLVVFLVALWLGPPPEASDKIPLSKAVEAGIRQDYDLRNRELDNKIAGINKDKAAMKKRFSISAEAAYLYKSEKMQLHLPIGEYLPMSPIKEIKQSIGTQHTYDIKVAVTQPIFTGGMLSNAVKLEEVKELLESDKKRMRELEVAGKIKASYYTYGLLVKKKSSTLLLLKNLKLHETRLNRFFEEELVRKSDVLETRIKITEAEMKLVDLDRAIAEERIRFARLCPFKIEAIEPNGGERIEDLESSLNYFTANHPVLKTLDRGKEMQTLRKKIVKGKYLPQIAGFGELHYGKPGIDFFKNEWGLYFQGGVGIKLAVFDWNELKKEKRIANLGIEKLDNRRKEIIADMRKGLAQLYEGKRSVEKQLGYVKKLVALAAEDAALKNDLYKENQLPNIDYLSALLTKERYESMESELELQVRLIKLNINTLIGRCETK